MKIKGYRIDIDNANFATQVNPHSVSNDAVMFEAACRLGPMVNTCGSAFLGTDNNCYFVTVGETAKWYNETHRSK